MQAIVMAAGEGRRLRPLTERWPKPILPVDGRPVIATLVRQLREEGLGPVTIVTGHLAEGVERLLDGDEGLRFVRQPAPEGSADAVRRALAAGAGLPVVVTAADTVFGTGDLGRFRDEFAASGAGGAIAYRRGRAATGIRVEGGLVRQVVDEPGAGPFSPAPLWGISGVIALDDLEGPPFELAAAFQRAIDAGKTVAGIEIGPTRGLTEPADLVRGNFPYLEAYERDV